MTATTQTLAAWLLEQIAADEAVARAAQSDRWWTLREMQQALDTFDAYGNVTNDAHFIARQDPAHVLAVCEAHRRIVEIHRPSTDHREGYLPYCVGCWEDGGEDGAPSYPCRTLRALAAIYADRDGFQEEWR